MLNKVQLDYHTTQNHPSNNCIIQLCRVDAIDYSWSLYPDVIYFFYTFVGNFGIVLQSIDIVHFLLFVHCLC